MATITVTIPDGWSKPKAAQQVAEHLTQHDATVVIENDAQGRAVTAKVTLPRTPPADSTSEKAEATRRQIERLRLYLTQYGWEEV